MLFRSKALVFVINGLDHEKSNFDKTVENMKDRFGSSIVLVQFPVNEGTGFNSFIDVITMKMYKVPAGEGKPEVLDIPEDHKSRANELHNELVEKAAENDVQVLLPVDHLAASEFSADAEAITVASENIPDGLIGMDVGPETLKSYSSVITNAKSLVWNGPLGVFEFDNFTKGTLEVAELVASCNGITVVGGGDSVAAVNKFGFADRIDHVSTGGGASLEYLEGKILPGIAALKE